jgi:hypothetical protein
MMQTGHPAPVAGYRVETDVDLSRVRTSMGDFVVSQLSDAVNIESRNALVVKSFRELVPDRKTLVFCVDVAHAFNLAAAFRHYGILAAPVTGNMPADERSENLAAFSSGRIQVLTNCMVLTGCQERSGETTASRFFTPQASGILAPLTMSLRLPERAHMVGIKTFAVRNGRRDEHSFR